MSSTNNFTTFQLSTSKVQGVKGNSSYPFIKTIKDIDSFKKATSYDHTVGRFKDNTRSKKGFLSADVICMDVDNDNKLYPEQWDNPDDWMTTQKFEEYFADYSFVLSTSKSHKQEKEGRSKRHRFHAYFPLGHEITTKEEYEEVVQYLVKLFVRNDGVSYFDTNATDCARFFFGHKGLRDIVPNSGVSILEWVAENKDKVQVKVDSAVNENQRIVGVVSSKSDEARSSLFKKGWKYKDIIKKLTVEDFYGELEASNETDSYWLAHCTTGRHDDKKPSLQIDKDTFSWYCHAGCGKGNVFDFIAMRDDTTARDIVSLYCDTLGIRNREQQVQVEVLDPQEDKEIEETPQDKAVKELNKKHALITVGGKTRIMKWMKQKRYVNDVPVEYPELEFMSRDDFITLYYNQTVPVGDKNINVAAIWLSHPNRRQYDGLDFDPSTTNPTKEGMPWNMWEDWNTGKIGFDRFIDEEKYKSIKDVPNAIEGCKAYVELIKEVICGNFSEKDKDKLLKYILYWMADAVKNPTKRTGTAIALKSGQGTGKSTFVGLFGELFGNYYTHMTDSTRLAQNFNWHMKDNLLLYSDEAFFAGDKKQAGLMKGLITESTRMLESKYVNAIIVNNFTRLILSSNEEWIIPSDIDDRRWMVIEVSGKKKNDRTFFGGVRDEWKNGGKECFLYFLREFIAKQTDFSTYDFTAERVITQAHWAQKIQSNKCAQWWVDVLERGRFDYRGEDGSTYKLPLTNDKDNAIYDVERIHNDYLNFSKKLGDTRYLMTTQHLSQELNKIGITFQRVRQMVDGDKKTVWMFPSLDKMRNDWETLTGDKQWSGIQDLDVPVLEQISKLLPDSQKSIDGIDADDLADIKAFLREKKRKKIKI